jgi:hypothetical protein
MNNYKYFDIDKLCVNDNENAESFKAITEPLDLSSFNNLSLVKLDLTADIPLMRVILDNNNPDVIVKDGYFRTIYNFVISYFKDGEIVDKKYNVWFHNHNEDYNNIAVKVENNNKIVDNFNEFFVIYNLEQLNHCVNESMSEAFTKEISNLEVFAEVVPEIHSTNNVLYYNILHSFKTDSTNYRFYQSRRDLINSGDNYGFTISYNYELFNLYFKVLEFEKNKLFNENYYSVVPVYYGSTTKVDINGENYYLYKYENSSYYEYCSDIKSVLVCTNIKTNSTYLNLKMQNYEIKRDNDILDNNMLNVFSRLNIDHDREHITRIIYSNSNIKNNTTTIYSNGSISNISVNIYILDKYGYYYKLNMHKYDNYTVELCLF